MEFSIFILLLIIASEVTYLIFSNSERVVRRRHQKPVFVDTSALIDSRILSVARTGFLKGKIFIPRSVIGELQMLADNSDSEKRSRARHGLDIVNELQGLPDVEIEIFQDSNLAEEGVDNRLLKLAKQYGGSICTIDYNLNKVARVEGIKVLNINDLAMSLRMSYLPGEKIQLDITNKGQEPHQAVGHIADGTMVVVENASSKIGQTIEVEFIRSLQTAAGKMMFAKMVSEKPVSAAKTEKPFVRKPYRKSEQKFNNNKPQDSNSQSNARIKQGNQSGGRSFKNKAARSEQNIVDLANRK